MLSAIILTPLLALAPIWESKDVLFTWDSKGKGYEYVVEAYTDRGCTKLHLKSESTTSSYLYVTFYENNLYFVNIRYSNDELQDYGQYYWGQFYLNLEHGYLGEDIIDFPPYDEEKEDIPNQPEIPPPIDKPEEKVDEETSLDYTLPPNLDEREDLPNTDDESVLGIEDDQQKEVCNIFIFREEEKVDASFACDLGISVDEVEHIDWGDYFSLEVRGKYFKEIEAYVRIFECKESTLLDPGTWFGCKKMLVDSYKGKLPLRYVGNIQVDGVIKPNSTWGFDDTSFFVRSIFSNDIYRRDVRLRLEVSSYVKSKEWIDFLAYIRKTVIVYKPKSPPSNKPFSFPFEKYIGVTQWHGCTAYQCPHKGMDFGSYKNKVVSIGDGRVVSAGYDKYGGECFQGGRYVIVKHSNGMHSTYFHLDSYSVRVGDIVKKGSLIGISGNSGKWNCQSLGYHLHFETRKNRYSSSHVNPVEYINADWSKIPTLGYTRYPGRLTGDNPHPNY